MIKVLFVCLGNICRSPLAEAIFNRKIKENGLESAIEADSCGTSNYHIDEDPDARSIEIALKKGTPIQHKGRQFQFADGKQFDYIIPMDNNNHEDILHVLGEAHSGLFKMREFDTKNKGADVPDPYYGGIDGFENIYSILDRSLDHFLDFLKEKHDL